MSDHRNPAFRAPALETGHAALMRFLMAALRTDAVSVRTGRKRAASAAGSPPAQTLPQSASHSSSALSHPIHDIPPVNHTVCAAEPAAFPAETARHGISASIEAPR